MGRPDDLFERYQGIVLKVAGHRFGSLRLSGDFDDLIQCGCIALWRCAQRWARDSDCGFVAYATSAIFRAMVRHYRWTRYTTQGGTIRLPVRVSELASAGKAGDPGLWGAHEPANGDDPCQRVDDRDELERSIMPYLSEKCARILEDLACGQSWSEIYQKYGYKTKASCRESFYQNIRGLAAKGILSRVTI